MVKEYKDWLFVTVPQDSKDWFISKLPFGDNDLVYPNGAGTCNYIGMLPDRDGSWQIIGKGDRIDWEGIVDEHVFISDDEGYYTETYFRDYEDVQQIVGSEYNLDEANKSGHSLLRSLEMEPGTTLVLKKQS